MAERIGIGMVGAGAVARARHVPGLGAIPGVDLVGVVNSSAESSERVCSEFAFDRTYPNWAALIADPDVDAVVIGTWPYLHAPITIAALDAGKHVLTQARMAMNAEEARAMLAAARRHPDLTAMVVPSPFSLGPGRAVGRLLADGAIGRPHSARLTWGGSPGVANQSPWRRVRRYSGNNVMMLGIVYESVARWLGHATAVQARTAVIDHVAPSVDGPRHFDIPDYVAALVEFPGGVEVTFQISAHAAFGETNAISVFGSEGTLRLAFETESLELANADALAFRPIEVAPHEREEWRVEAEFIGAIRGENHVRLTDFETGVRYMEFTDAVRAAAASGSRVAL